MLNKKGLIDVHATLVNVIDDLNETTTCFDHGDHSDCDLERIVRKVIELRDFVRGEMRSDSTGD